MTDHRPLRGAVWLIGCIMLLSCGDEIPAASFEDPPRREVRIDSAAYAAIPQLSLDSIGVLCPRPGRGCPTDELVLAGRAGDGDLAIATRMGSVFLYPAGDGPEKQIGFEKSQGSRRGLGGILAAIGDTAWVLHPQDSPHLRRFDDAGRALGTDAARLAPGYAGSAASLDLFVQWHIPGAEQLGDTVESTFLIVAPASRKGTTIARVHTPAQRLATSTGQPLAPFFNATPVWGVTPRGALFFSSADHYELAILDSAGVAIRLVAAAPRIAVDPAELEDAAARFLAKMPNNARFREAAAVDVERRKRLSAKFHPSITDIRVMESGGLLVRGGPHPDSDRVRWDLFDGELRPRGYFELDGLDRLLLVVGDTLLLGRTLAGGQQIVQWTVLR